VAGHADTWTRVNSLTRADVLQAKGEVDPTVRQRVRARRRGRRANCGRAVAEHRRRQDAPKVARPAGNPPRTCTLMWNRPKGKAAHPHRQRLAGFFVHLRTAARRGTLNTLSSGQFPNQSRWTRRKPYRVYGGPQDNGSWGGGVTSSADGRRRGLVQHQRGPTGRCRVDPFDGPGVLREPERRPGSAEPADRHGFISPAAASLARVFRWTGTPVHPLRPTTRGCTTRASSRPPSGGGADLKVICAVANPAPRWDAVGDRGEPG